MNNRDVPEVYLSLRFTEALAYSMGWHKDQPRKATKLPYILHPLGVASLVLEAGGDEDLAIAGLLHDVPEDCGGEPRLTEIENQFGTRVAEIVRACSDTLVEDRADKTDYQERKLAHLEHLKTVDEGILIVTAADKLHNARAIATDFLNHGEELWGRFNGSKEQIYWYYESIYFLLKSRQVNHVLMTPLRETLKLIGCPVGLDYFYELDSKNQPQLLIRFGSMRGIQQKWDGNSWKDTKKVSDYFWDNQWLEKTTELEAIERFPAAFGL